MKEYGVFADSAKRLGIDVDIQAVERLNLKPGDILVVTLGTLPLNPYLSRYKQHWDKLCAAYGATCVFVSDVKLQVIESPTTQ